MVGIAVVDTHSPGLSLALHATTGAGERTEPSGEVGVGVAEAETGDERGRRIEHVVPPRHGELDSREDLTCPAQPERGRSAGEGDVGHLPVVVGAFADGDRGHVAGRVEQRACAGIVAAEDETGPSGSIVPTNSANAAWYAASVPHTS